MFGKISLHIRMQIELKERLQELAKADNKRLSIYVRDLIIESLKGRGLI